MDVVTCLDWFNAIGTFIFGISSIILGVIVYKQTTRIAEMQKEMDDKNLKANMLENRMECYEYMHSVFRTIFEISNASPYYLNSNDEFYKILDKSSFNSDDVLKFHMNLGKISGLYSQSITDLAMNIINEIQDMNNNIDYFKFEKMHFDEDEEIRKVLDKVRVKIIENSREIRSNCSSILEMMIKEMKV